MGSEMCIRDRIINHGERIVSLTGGVTSDAFIREVQWDVFGSRVIHIDFTRVAAGELLDTTVSIGTRGVAPGTKVGGTVEQPLQEMAIKLPPRSMTDHIEVVINGLGMDEKITLADLDLPDGAKYDLDPSTVVVQCIEKVEKAAEDDETAVADMGAEPEVIGEKKDDEGGSDS